MKTFTQLMMEVAQPKSEDELNFKLKHEIEFFDHPASEEGQHTSDKKKAKRIADYDTGEDMAVNEEEMTDAQMKRREEIVKGMKKNKADMEKRYGDKWKEVMYATATKQAMKESASENMSLFKAIEKKKMQKEELDLEKGFKSRVMKLKDKSEVTLSGDDVSALNKLFNNVSSSSANKMKMSMMKDKKGFDEILSFAREAM